MKLGIFTVCVLITVILGEERSEVRPKHDVRFVNDANEILRQRKGRRPATTIKRIRTSTRLWRSTTARRPTKTPGVALCATTPPNPFAPSPIRTTTPRNSAGPDVVLRKKTIFHFYYNCGSIHTERQIQLFCSAKNG